MIYLLNALSILAQTLAFLEFLIFRSPSPSFFRTLYLKLMRVKFQKPFSLGHDIYIRNPGNLILGKNCALGSFTRIWNYEKIEIGDDFLSAGGLTLNSATHDPVTLQSIGSPIKIGHRVWCGLNVTILSGVTIGDDVVIGAGSLVNRDIPSNSVAVGVPAKKIKDLIRK
jgi:acetyltransferase-like isoleucine patch superfamily enzyme